MVVIELVVVTAVRMQCRPCASVRARCAQQMSCVSKHSRVQHGMHHCRDQYEYAYKVWVKERDEAVSAVEVARTARLQWDADKLARCKDRNARERNRYHTLPHH